jgi:DNA-binding response OmpR family regulator
VVDDDANLLEILSLSTITFPLRSLLLTDAEVAKAKILEQQFSALLTDALPGHETVISTFKTHNPHAPAVVLTGSLRPELEERALSAGADLVLYKPIGMAALKESLQNLITAAAQPSSRSRRRHCWRPL